MSASDAWLKAAVADVDPPVLETFPAGGPYGGEPYRYGSRVPCLVVGPYAKPEYVSHVPSSHASLVAFIERLWGLPPSPNPDAAARTTSPDEHAMQDCVDLNQQPLPPPILK